ncbi:MAG: glycoside hydrolase family 2 TIM barrel-domain containing protein, partial [Bacteroidota bacterium]
MASFFRSVYYLGGLILFALTALSGCTAPATEEGVSAANFNDGWEFALEGEAFAPVSLPHDWSVSFPFDSIKGEGATGYLLGGIGTYRKNFASPAAGISYLHFDGVYNNATVSLNGQELGFHPFGYAPFYYVLNDFLKPAGELNKLEVRVDHSRYADSRWYTGSGIYRDVHLFVVPELHIPVWGTFVTTPEVSETSALVQVAIELKQSGAKTQDAKIVTELRSPLGDIVATAEEKIILGAGDSSSVTQTMQVDNPALWDVDSPQLYKAVTRLVVAGATTQTYHTPFGIRTFRFDPDEGFFLNGRNRKIKGVCLHHDGGAVGAAVPKAVWRRRLQTLKDGGCNAIRSAHNPASQEFLDLCDEMGFLVQDDFYDEWDYPKDKRLNMGETKSTDYITRGHHEHFQEWAKEDLQNTVLAHRNHPSIIQWSIGNEIEWTYKRQKETTGFFGADANGNYFWNEPPYSTDKIRSLQETIPRHEYHIGTTAQKLADWTRAVDTTRPVVANCILPSASYESGYADALDVIGYSYRRVMYDYGHRNYPDLPVMGTENLGQYHEWKAVMERDFVSGTFLWTGIDYLGESNGGWPKKQTNSGLLDLAGFPRSGYYMMQALWTDEPMINLTTQALDQSIYRQAENGEVVEQKPGRWERALWVWHPVNNYWNYPEGEMVVLEAISNCPEAELFLNGESLGRKKLADFPDHIYKWATPYAAGQVTVKGYRGGAEVVQTMQTSGPPVNLELTTEGTEEDGVVHVVAQLVDVAGLPVRDDDQVLNFS